MIRTIYPSETMLSSTECAYPTAKRFFRQAEWAHIAPLSVPTHLWKQPRI